MKDGLTEKQKKIADKITDEMEGLNLDETLDHIMAQGALFIKRSGLTKSQSMKSIELLSDWMGFVIECSTSKGVEE